MQLQTRGRDTDAECLRVVDEVCPLHAVRLNTSAVQIFNVLFWFCQIGADTALTVILGAITAILYLFEFNC